MFNQFSSLQTFSISDSLNFDFAAPELRSAAILITLAVLIFLETRIGLQKPALKTVRQSYKTNLFTLVFNDVIMSLLSVSSLLLLAEHYAGLGLLSHISNPALKSIVSLLLLDLTLYLWHRANHTFDWLWLFHKAHHSDRHMNVTTAFRLHFVEVFLTTIVKAGFIMLIGVNATMLLANEVLITLSVMFHHTNISFRGENILGRVIFVPYLHRVHHSALREEHDHNYGALFSVWDRLFGTFLELQPAEFGLRDVSVQNFFALLKYGFKRATSQTPQSLQAMIAEAAYFKAEKRRFMPGNDLRDWLEAEKEIAAYYMPKGDLLSAKF